MDEQTVTVKSKADQIEDAVRAASENGNTTAYAMYRASRGLPKVKKETMLLALAIETIGLGEELSKIINGGQQ